MPYGSETMPLLQLIRWMCSISMKDRSTSEELRRLVGVVRITNVIRTGILRWYENFDENWAKKCMEFIEDQEGHG